MLESIRSPKYVWNKLSTDCVHANVIRPMFTNRIDKYLVKADYTQNRDRLHVE